MFVLPVSGLNVYSAQKSKSKSITTQGISTPNILTRNTVSFKGVPIAADAEKATKLIASSSKQLDKFVSETIAYLHKRSASTSEETIKEGGNTFKRIVSERNEDHRTITSVSDVDERHQITRGADFEAGLDYILESASIKDGKADTFISLTVDSGRGRLYSVNTPKTFATWKEPGAK